jgi:hypothetical protein
MSLKMTAEKFRRLVIKLFGPERGSQTRCAKALGADRSSVSRWLSGEVSKIPGPVAAAMESWNEALKYTGKFQGNQKLNTTIRKTGLDRSGRSS